MPPGLGTEVLPQGVTEVFLGQGLIGTVALLLLLAVAFLYRTKESGRDKLTDKYEAALAAQSDKYHKLIEVKDAVIQKLQEDRVSEMKAGMTQIAAANAAMDQTAAGFEAALDVVTKQRMMS